MIEELTPLQAWAHLGRHAGAASLLDVRSTVEYDYVGHPIGAVHVPIKEAPSWQLDPLFVDKVCYALAEKESRFGDIKLLPILVICRSGKRSLLAGELLIDSGFKKVYNVIEGFEGEQDENGHRNTVNGWRFHELPWEQS